MGHLVLACRSVSIMKVCLVLSCRLVQPRNDLTCNLCVTVLTQLDNFITSDTTEGEIVEFVEQICSALGALVPGLEDTCKSFIEANLPGIIDDIVANNLNPQTTCANLGMCP